MQLLEQLPPPNVFPGIKAEGVIVWWLSPFVVTPRFDGLTAAAGLLRR